MPTHTSQHGRRCSTRASSAASGGERSALGGPAGVGCLLELLPDELLAASIIDLLDFKELLQLQACDRRLLRLASNDAQWRQIFEAAHGPATAIQQTARTLAGSWQALLRAKALTAKEAGEWRKPSTYELQAALQMMTAVASPDSASASSSSTEGSAGTTTAAAARAGNEEHDMLPLLDVAAGAAGASEDGTDSLLALTDDSSAGLSRTDSGTDSTAANNTGAGEALTRLAVVFLVDSSGSVGDEDFEVMTSFLDTAASALAAAPACKVSVVQFSNDTRVEVGLAPLNRPAFDAAVRGMVRLNGGTNIAAAIAKAGSLFKGEGPTAAPDMKRVLVLLTDGRIDGFQAREAAAMVARLADEQGSSDSLALWALGVGRGVDAAELVRIIEAPSSGGGSSKGSGEGSGTAAKTAGKAAAAGPWHGLPGRERYLDLCVRDDAPW